MSLSVAAFVDGIFEKYNQAGRTFTDNEWAAIARLVRVIPKFPHMPGSLFLPVMSLNVPAGVELILVRDQQVFLTWRDDPPFQGIHIPGTYIAPGEDLLQAAQRCGDKELNIRITSVKPIATVNNPTNPRFHDLCVLVHCEFEGQPTAGSWFAKCPVDLLAVQRDYWGYIEPLLSQTH